MKAAILSIGTEVTRGEITDTNAPWLAARLTALGFEVAEITAVPDEPPRIEAALRRLANEPGVVVSTGGLGPTADDLTVAAVAAILGVETVHDPVALENLRRRFAVVGRAPNATAERQTLVPAGAEVLGNPAGLAPAFRVRIGQGDFFFLPGVPSEMTRIFDECVIRRVGGLTTPRSHQVVLRTYGAGESTVAERIGDLAALFPGVTVGYRARFPEIDVKLLARADDPNTARTLAERAATEARNRLGDLVFGEHDDQFAAAVGRALRSRGWTLAIAESCTGGLLGAVLTAVPGASEYLLLDAVVYANSAKTAVLGVPSEVLLAHGAVSAECVRAMAEGARRAVQADLAIAVSGVAGPTGGSVDKPVGTVFFALASPRGTAVRRLRFLGDRERVQRQAAWEALAMVRAACRGPVETSLPSVCG
jgi:nicotinamide-nucleotide amidase